MRQAEPWNSEVRQVAFLLPLERPHRIPAGSVVLVSAEFLADLRAVPGSERAIADLTISPLGHYLSYAFWIARAVPAQASSAVVVPCPECARKVGVSVCTRCGGTRRLVHAVADAPEIGRRMAMRAREAFNLAENDHEEKTL